MLSLKPFALIRQKAGQQNALFVARACNGSSSLPPTILSLLQHVQQGCRRGFGFSAHRAASSASSNRWKTRQANDAYTRDARVAGLKSRAAFKLLQINDRYRIFRRGNTVVDLGYAPGSWSQVAANRCAPGGRVVGVDILPAQPPRGVSTIQGDFLSPAIQAEVRAYVSDPERGRPRPRQTFGASTADDGTDADTDEEEGLASEQSYIDMERHSSEEASETLEAEEPQETLGRRQREQAMGRVVDVVLSDMCEPWEQTSGFGKKSLSDPYRRLMNTSGMPFRDHAGSMDLCTAALEFAYDTLRTGGCFVCKFYQGAEDKLLEKRIKRLFDKVHREKPAASRSESREGYFVALRRKDAPEKAEVFAE